MHREIHNWWSPRLNKHMEIAVYGHYGFAVLMFPTAGADYLEYERFHLLDTLAPMIDQGKFKVFSINSINNESWLNNNMHPYDKAVRHQQYNEYVLREVVPFIYTHCQGHVPIITTGASLGALHAANIFFRRPDVFDGTIAMSGVYRLTAYTRGYFDDNVYFNSPIDYLPNWGDEFMLNRMREKGGNIIIASGQGEYEDPSSSIELSNILHGKGVPHMLDLWGHDMRHDWPTWRQMLPYFLGTKF
ncbi:MAG: alpha/beta hydrolase-fold protein [Calditrichia bacterium]|nr:esterase family protein [Calditrichota bacterium]MCB0267769.1 esterase family protein [Calditrichota bacterium]MCB0285694.1 esterase family protein [Calditrichota bacterium]MCB9068895.1 esterase family protein [Calditrichia bacterium]